jgi:hypothetical protein
VTAGEFKKLRERVGSQAHVARLLACHPISIAKWETGTLPVSDARAAEITTLARDAAFAFRVVMPKALANAGTTETYVIPATTEQERRRARKLIQQAGGRRVP